MGHRPYLKSHLPTPAFVEKWGRVLGGFCDTSRRMGLLASQVELPPEALAALEERDPAHGVQWMF